MNFIRTVFLVIVVLQLTACSELQKIADSALSSQGAGSMSPTMIGNGLREALQVGIGKGADIVSLKDGYFKNEAIKILFPTEAMKVKEKLDALPGGKMLTDNLIEKLNRAAEDAAKSAKPIFIDAIKQMTINDAMSILKGPENAATSYLNKTTNDRLYAAFRPVVDNSLGRVQALNAWDDVINTYNRIPFVEKMNPDIKDYVTRKALDGLFHMVAKEEKNIRTNLAARTSDLLKKVFALQDKK